MTNSSIWLSAINNALDGLVDDNDLGWFGEELLHATCNGLLLHIVGGVGSDCCNEWFLLDHLVLPTLANHARALKAIHLGHVDVHEDQLEGAILLVTLNHSVESDLAIQCCLGHRIRVVCLDRVLEEDQVEHLVIHE